MIDETSSQAPGKKLEDYIGKRIWLIFDTGRPEPRKHERHQGIVRGVDTFELIIFEEIMGIEKGFNRDSITTWEPMKDGAK